MNINVDIKLPLKTGKLITVGADLFLTPFYVSEMELLDKYLSKYNTEQYNEARRIIFSSSITADTIIRNRLKDFPEKDQILFKRDLTLCLATLAFGHRFNSDFIKSMTRSKTLASFQVTTSISRDTGNLSGILKDAENCIEEAKKFLDDIASMGEGIIASFVKSELHCTARRSDRLWHHYLLPDKSYHAYASTKIPYRGRLYKNGS